MEIGSRLSELRKKYGYTQKQLAEALNLSQQRVSNIEMNKKERNLVNRVVVNVAIVMSGVL